MTRAPVAWAIACLDVFAMAVVGLLSPTLGVVGAVVFAFGIGSFAAVGALLMARVPANPIGGLLLAAGTLLAAAMVAGAYADIGDVQAPSWIGSDVARVIQTALFVLPFFMALIGVPLVFPDGRLPSRRFVWMVGTTVTSVVTWPVATFLRALLGGELGVEVADPGQLSLLAGAIDAVFIATTSVSFAAGAIAIALRFRRGGPVEREQIKWLLAVAAVGAAILPVSFTLDSATQPVAAEIVSNLTVLTLFALPIVIAIAILRYRLFEIDRIISRTISWALVTVMLVGTVAAGVLALQAVLSGFTQGETLAVAASTLLAFALFQPIRRRVQAIVDRRFDRARYDAARTADGFAERVRNEVDLSTLRLSLVHTANESVRPGVSAVWLRAERGDA